MRSGRIHVRGDPVVNSNQREINMKLAIAAAWSLPALVLFGCASTTPVGPIDQHVRSNPQTVVFGELPAGRQPVATIKSGQTVRIDTISHQGLISGTDPVSFFGAAGIPANEVLADAMAVYPGMGARPKEAGAHVLTGPIFVEGAEPGDMLEVRIRAIDFRVPYGVNNSGKGVGELPAVHEKPYPKVIKFDLNRRVALFAPGIEVPLSPFMGIMIVAPPSERLASTRPPGIYGGNMDMRRLTVGSSLYLPVHRTGGLFYTGDAHAVQGDGEVNGTAIETSLSPVLQFIVHKGGGRDMKWPQAEDAANFYVMGMDVVLDKAMSEAVQETVNLLQKTRGLTAADSYSLASIGVNYVVGETVDQVKMIYGEIPKKMFLKGSPFWSGTTTKP
jgi:acetamidase/formamidase